MVDSLYSIASIRLPGGAPAVIRRDSGDVQRVMRRGNRQVIWHFARRLSTSHMQIDIHFFQQYSLVLVVGILVGLTGCRKFPVDSEGTSEPNPDDLTVAVNTRFQLDHGDFVELGETGMQVHFKNVLEDNRCPAESICGRVGRAGIRLVVVEEGTPDSEIVMYIPGEVDVPYEENGAVFYKGRYFRLLALDPYPFSDVSVAESSYRALLRIEQPE